MTFPDPEETQAHIVFDLTAPIEPQLTCARRLLLARQKRLLGSKKRLNGRPDKWAHYLRILDADAAQVTKQEICDALYPAKGNAYPEKPAYDAFKKDRHRARHLRDGGYLHMMIIKPRWGK